MPEGDIGFCRGGEVAELEDRRLTPLERSGRDLQGISQPMKIAVFLLLSTFLMSTSAQQLVNEQCSLGSNERGVCKPFRQCKSAMTLLSQGIQPQICSFERDVPVVCCKREGTHPVRPHPNKPGGHHSSTNNPYDWPDFNKRPTQQQHGGPPKPRPTQSGGTSFGRPPGVGGSRPKRRISERKCEEYSELVTDRVQGLPLVLQPDPVSINIAKCPEQGLHLIVGGEETDPGEYPHMAAIGYQRQGSEGFDWDCGGSLISDSFVLTAAHCVHTRKGNPAVVRVGEWDLRRGSASASLFHSPGQSGIRDGESSGDYRISRVIKHPNYHPPAKYNDIALLELQRPVRPFTHLVRPACLYSRPTFNASAATATGWGRIDFAEDPSDVLLKVALSVIDGDTCNRLYIADRRTNKLPRGIIRTMMCAGELQGGKDTCQGDSGGPLQIQGQNNNCMHYIVGVTSFGKLCAAPNAPGVYTRVSSYIPWIESIVWPTG